MEYTLKFVGQVGSVALDAKDKITFVFCFFYFYCTELSRLCGCAHSVYKIPIIGYYVIVHGCGGQLAWIIFVVVVIVDEMSCA